MGCLGWWCVQEGNVLVVTLIDGEGSKTINQAMVEEVS